jgi:branched-chain amino acid transport system permease protein
MLTQFLINGLVIGAVYALVALGFGIIYHTTRIFHIAHGAVFTATAYLLYLFYGVLSLPLALSVLSGLLGAMLLGFIVQRYVYDPVMDKRQNPLILFISSLGVYIVVINLIALLFGNETKILFAGVEPTVTFGSIILTRMQIIQFIGGLLTVSAVLIFLKKNRIGHFIQALADNHVLLSLLGIKVRRVRQLVITLGSALAGLAAMLLVLDVGMDPYIGMDMLLTAAVATIVGGVGNYSGTVLGAGFLGLVQSLVVWQTSARWQPMVTFIILLLVLFVRPRGLFSHKIRVEEA